LADYIYVPQANLRNIAIFDEEPGAALLQEIRQHIKQTHCPHTWRGHSHTKPPAGAFPVYCDEFDVPAPDTVPRVAPCPCCNPNYPQYKNKGKVAWFPDERVIRLIGPQCFAAINEGAHQTALIDLRKKQKARSELAVIRLHSPRIEGLVAIIDEVVPIASALDTFMQELNGAFDNELAIPLWRIAKGGTLTINETREVPYRKPDGSVGTKRQIFAVHFADIIGQTMIDRSGLIAAEKKLKPLRSGLIAINDRLIEVGNPEQLDETERKDFSEKMPRAQAQVREVLDDARSRQQFLTSGAIDTLARWGQHPNAPYRFAIKRKGSGIALTSANQRSSSPVNIDIASHATKKLPDLPVIGEG
jgi:hypothetical protein